MRSLAPCALLVLTSLDAFAADEGRDLPAKGTFADLVRAARALDEKGMGASSAGCLLRTKSGGARLEAALDPGSHPIGDPPEDLDELLANPLDFTLWSRLGETGTGAFVLIALTPVARSVKESGLLPVLIQTDRGLWFSAIAPQGTFGASGARPQLLKKTELARFQKDILPRAQAVIITAEAGVPLDRFAETLAMMKSFEGTVVLAVPAREGAKRPVVARSEAEEDASDICRTGIQDIPPGEKPGELPMTGMTKMVEGLQEAVAKACTPEGADAGGRLRVSMRIGKMGKPTKSCIEKDSTHDAKIRACVLKVIDGTTFAKPVKGTFVNFGTEVTLTPPSAKQRALCR